MTDDAVALRERVAFLERKIADARLLARVTLCEETASADALLATCPRDPTEVLRVLTDGAKRCAATLGDIDRLLLAASSTAGAATDGVEVKSAGGGRQRDSGSRQSSPSAPLTTGPVVGSASQQGASTSPPLPASPTDPASSQDGPGNTRINGIQDALEDA